VDIYYMKAWYMLAKCRVIHAVLRVLVECHIVTRNILVLGFVVITTFVACLGIC